MKFSPERNEIFPAYVKSWGQIKTLEQKREVKIENFKDAKKSYKYSYTDLTDIYDEIRELLLNNDIAIMHDSYTSFDALAGYDKNYMNTMLLHSSGQYIEGGYISYKAIYDIKTDYSKNQFTVANMKDNGGQLTYMRRFSLLATLGLSTDEAREQEKQNPMFDNPGSYQQMDTFGNKAKAAEKEKQQKDQAFLDKEPQKIKMTNDDPIQLPPPMIEEAQVLEVERLLKVIGETQKHEGQVIPADDVYKQIQNLYPVLSDSSYRNLSRDSAIKVLNMLRKFKSGELVLFPE